LKINNSNQTNKLNWILQRNFITNNLSNYSLKYAIKTPFDNDGNKCLQKIEKSHFHTYIKNKGNSSKNFGLLQKATNKTFLDKIYKGYFQTLVMQNIPKEDEYVDITEPVVFEGEKFVFLDMDPNKPDYVTKFVVFSLLPLSGLAGYKLFMAISSFAIFRSFFWSFIFLYLIKFRYGILCNQEHIIKELSILEDGKTLHVKTVKNSFNMDINSIRKINFEEAMFMADKLESIKINYIPIVMETKLYLIPLRSRILNKDILGSVSEGKYLRFEEIIHKDKTIQI